MEANQIAVMPRAPTHQDSSPGAVAIGSEAAGHARPSVVNHPEMQATFPSSSTNAKIPHMSTFLNTMSGSSIPNMGVPFATATNLARPINSFPPNIQAIPGQFFPSRVSVAVETEEIRKTTVGTNTENSQHLSAGGIDQSAVMSSVGTMTDSLYKVSVGTGTAGTGQPNGQSVVTAMGESHPNIVEKTATGQELNQEKPCQAVVNVTEINPAEILQEALHQGQITQEVMIQEEVVEEVVGVSPEVAKITPIGDGI